MEHFILTFGIFFVLGSILAIIFRFFKQSSILAYILAGIIIGLFKEKIQIPHEIIEIFTELGIIFLLFMAGMEININEIKKKWNLTIVSGLGQIVLATGLGFLLAIALLQLKGVVVPLYFALCLTFSSTIIVISLLKQRKETDSLHGQILIGLLIIQDIFAILALVILDSLTGEGSFLISLLLVIAKAIGITLIMYLFSRYILNYIFKKFAENAELLFIGTLGWVLGISALCELIKFSPEIGAFLAGVSLASIPYKIEIEDKVEPIKNFGVILFFVALGYKLDINREILSFLPEIALVSLFVLITTPIIMTIIGYIEKLRRRPVVFMGFMLNQISEFSLILATLCLNAGLFSKEIFTIVTFSSILTILLSSIGHSKIDSIQSVMTIPLKFVEARARREEVIDKDRLKDHIIVLGYNAIADQITDRLNEKGYETVIFDYDPNIYHHYMDKTGKPKIANKIFIYADATDPDTWEEFKFHKAALIISCLVKNHEAEMRLLKKLKEEESNAEFIITANKNTEALQAFENGASYVILTDFFAGKKASEILSDLAPNWEGLRGFGKEIKDLIEKEENFL